MKDKNNFFPQNLSFLRKEKGMTQTELANKINVDQTTIGRWEDGNREPTIGNVVNIANVFNISILDLLDKDLKIETNVKLDESHILDKIIMDKTAVMDENTKKMLIGIMDTINKNIDDKSNNPNNN